MGSGTKMPISAPKPLWFLVMLIWGSREAVGSGNGLHTYIVQMSMSEKPSIFTSAHSWYHSTVSDVKGAVTNNVEEVSSSITAGNNMLHTYSTVFDGFAARLTTDQAQALESRRGVLKLYPDRVMFLHTTHTPEFLGLNLSSGLLPESNYGEDVIIGVLDAGIWPERASFSDENIGPIPSKWKGSCVQEPSFNASVCNRKLIGAKYYLQGYEAEVGSINTSLEYKSPRDSVGHGTHTASTAGGSIVSRASLLGVAQGTAQGMAPQARLAIYKVCWLKGCLDSDILAAIDAAVSDGVDILSISLGGERLPYYLEPIAIGSYRAVKNGVFVSCSAGNGGPKPGTLLNTAPWITTVAASTVDRSFPANVKLGNGATIQGASLSTGPGLGDKLLPVIHARNASKDGLMPSTSAVCLEGTLDPAQVHGKIVICNLHNISSVKQAEVVKAAGGAGMIVRVTAIDGLPLRVHVLPTITLGAKATVQLKSYLLSTLKPTATFSFEGTVLGVKPSPLIASFSARGPNREIPGILKPDITAPGVNILAAWTGFAPTDPEFHILSGTSMSCPHISGIAALLKGAHPTWSPAMIKSAIMTSAYVYDNLGGVLRDGATGSATTPFSYGAGHVNPQKALDPGLVYDLETIDYISFLCSLGSNYTASHIRLIDSSVTSCPNHTKGSPTDLNYPSFSVLFEQANSTALSTSFYRTVTNVGPPNSTYKVNLVAPQGVKMTVVPSVLEFSEKGQKHRFRVDMETELVALTHEAMKTEFGSFAWTDGSHVVHSPVVANWL